MRIFIGNLPNETTQGDLRQAFEPFGQVTSVTIVADAGESKSRGFGFVIMPLAQEAQNAIKEMHGQNFKGQRISVEKSQTSSKARANRRKRSGSATGGGAKKSRASNSGGRRGKRRH